MVCLWGFVMAIASRFLSVLPLDPQPDGSPPAASAVEFLAWSTDHARRNRLHGAELAQITTHPDRHPEGDVRGQQKAWARRHARERHLHDSALAQLRHR